MKLTILAILTLGAIALLSQPEPACAYGGCGAMIPKPPTPWGCRDLTPVCQCDAQGRNCHWTWVCVR